MSLVTLIDYPDASPEVRAVYDDIMRTRGTDWINVARLFDPAEYGQLPNPVGVVTNGTNEWQMRNQFRAWSKFMTMSMRSAS